MRPWGEQMTAESKVSVELVMACRHLSLIWPKRQYMWVFVEMQMPNRLQPILQSRVHCNYVSIIIRCRRLRKLPNFCRWRLYHYYVRRIINKANLRDFIAATGLVILLKSDSNRRFFSPCDLEIWWTTQKNNRAPLLCYFKAFCIIS